MKNEVLRIFGELSTELRDDDETNITRLYKKSNKASRLLKSIQASDLGQHYRLRVRDILLLTSLWKRHMRDESTYVSSVDVMRDVHGEGCNPFIYFDQIIELLQRQVLYTSVKKHVNLTTIHEPTKHYRYSKRHLLNEDIQLHHDFLNRLFDEQDPINDKLEQPYSGNKEYLSDAFTYVSKLYDLRYFNDYKDIRFDEEMDDSTARDFVDVYQWKDRINTRLELTEEVFPLVDISDEYTLDDNEQLMLIYLIKEDLEGSSVDTDELLKLVSPDQHALYNNRRYLAMDSTLVKRGLVEINENVFMRSRGSEVRITPDIMKQIILDTPINDEERLNQILKGNDIFTLIDPNYGMDDLILSNELKQTLLTSISRYDQDVDATLAQWNLYDGRMDVVGQVKKKIEPGLLMLLHGPSGTGKTFASGAVARHLGKKLLVTDISRLQSMWVGESEKNVKRLFTIFERIVRRVENPPVLLLNEADQFLSTRMTETRDSVDQMNNTLQNLFLEGFERLRGVMIATTNLQNNMDSAFSRRFHLKLELPVPGEPERQELWKLHLPSSIPLATDVDIQLLARKYVLSGGQIKIIVQNAATAAASRIKAQRILKMDDLLQYCDIEFGGMNRAKNKIYGFSA